ncbi:MAG: EF-P beta-lysylation protein EpmB [Planctomycetaceae bacterium]|jgi:L-lysine 2,3-aminomutase|nr:EF-P beta-lysylation protein EpmB [Planctomycetaceae bacterium]
MSNEFITEIDELIRILGLSSSMSSDFIYESDYSLLVPRDFVKLMEKGNPDDPLLMQVLPRLEENNDVVGFTSNPLDEKINTDLPILKKYCGRALLMLTRRCGIHCRFCFRRHLLSDNARLDCLSQRDLLLPKMTSSSLNESNLQFCDSVEEFDLAMESVFKSIMFDESIREVIFSGGDPFTQSDGQIKRALDYIVKIPHVKRIRIHSRMPVIIPKRITERLNDILSCLKPIYLVLHVNHPNELSDELLTRLKLLTSPVLLSQTVLLRGINDSVEVLVKLFEMLADHRVIPYYLHQLDRVSGASHFEVDISKGQRIISRLRELLSGYAIPRYVQEIAGENCKKLLL